MKFTQLNAPSWIEEMSEIHHHRESEKQPMNPRYALLASGCAVGTVCILIAIKSYTYYLSGSTAMLGSLTDSVVDLAVSLMLLFAVKLSLKPADNDHRFGHGKVEGIAALMQGAFMAGAGLFLIFEANIRLLNPQEIIHHKITMVVGLIAIIMSLIVVSVQRFVLKRAPSLAIEADHAHYKTDIFLNGGVIMAVGIHYYGGPVWLDSAIALLIAAYFLSTAWHITNKSLDMLMDKELSDDVRTHIENIVAENSQVHDLHDLRTRMSGMNMHISFDVELEPTLTLEQAHDIVRELDKEILEYYPNAEIIIHMDPIGDTSDPRHSVAGVHH